MASERQIEATAKLDAAIKECRDAFVETEGHGFERTATGDLIVTEWVVLVGVLGDDESTVDMLLPHFPAVPMHHVKGLLVEALDDLRVDEQREA